MSPERCLARGGWAFLNPLLLSPAESSAQALEAAHSLCVRGRGREVPRADVMPVVEWAGHPRSLAEGGSGG